MKKIFFLIMLMVSLVSAQNNTIKSINSYQTYAAALDQLESAVAVVSLQAYKLSEDIFEAELQMDQEIRAKAKDASNDFDVILDTMLLSDESGIKQAYALGKKSYFYSEDLFEQIETTLDQAEKVKRLKSTLLSFVENYEGVDFVGSFLEGKNKSYAKKLNEFIQDIIYKTHYSEKVISTNSAEMKQNLNQLSMSFDKSVKMKKKSLLKKFKFLPDTE